MLNEWLLKDINIITIIHFLLKKKKNSFLFFCSSKKLCGVKFKYKMDQKYQFPSDFDLPKTNR